MGQKRKIAIVGGGASGMVAAIMAAREGASVTLFEQKERLGKKILSTGNGRCNYTNANMDISCFRGEELSIVEHVLRRFGTEDTLRFFEKLGIVPKERNGYYYPQSDQAAAVLDVLCMEIRRLHVMVHCQTKVLSIQKRKDFVIRTSEGQFHADAVILSTGGQASPVLGSDGSGYALAKALGHHMTPVVPALVQLHGKGTFFKMVSGVRVDAKVSLYAEGERLASDFGEVQLTNYGISGIPVFQISRYAAMALYEKKRPVVNLDFMPKYSERELHKFLKERRAYDFEKTAEEFFIGMLNRKLIPVLLRASAIRQEQSLKEVTAEDLERFAKKCKAFEIEITGTNSFEQAQICAGGIRTREIHPETLESRIVQGLYLTGELLDVDGICGGYNLQWAWATGTIAGMEAAAPKKGTRNDSN